MPNHLHSRCGRWSGTIFQAAGQQVNSRLGAPSRRTGRRDRTEYAPWSEDDDGEGQPMTKEQS